MNAGIASSIMAIKALRESMYNNLPNLKDLERELNTPAFHSRQGKRFKSERVYLAQPFKDRKDVMVLPSGAAYGVKNGVWHRLNHPKNKHDRRKEAAIKAYEAEYGRAIKH
jgi:hypothetical protein